VRHPHPPPTFFYKDVIPKELFGAFMQGYHSMALSGNYGKGAIRGNKRGRGTKTTLLCVNFEHVLFYRMSKARIVSCRLAALVECAARRPGDEMHALRQVRPYKQGEWVVLRFQEEDVLNSSVSVTGFHCGHCQFLMLTMDSSAVPAEALEPVKE
jgi:hypothetical protein